MTMMNRITDSLFTQPRTSQASDQPFDMESLSEQAKQWLATTERVVKSNPGISLMAAAGVGILLGWLVKRS